MKFPKPGKAKKKKEGLSFSEWADLIWNTQPHICEVCGVFIYERLKHNFHHIISRKQGGKNTLENGKLLCYNCHHETHTGKRPKQDWLI